MEQSTSPGLISEGNKMGRGVHRNRRIEVVNLDRALPVGIAECLKRADAEKCSWL